MSNSIHIISCPVPSNTLIYDPPHISRSRSRSRPFHILTFLYRRTFQRIHAKNGRHLTIILSHGDFWEWKDGKLVFLSAGTLLRYISRFGDAVEGVGWTEGRFLQIENERESKALEAVIRDERLWK